MPTGSTASSRASTSGPRRPTGCRPIAASSTRCCSAAVARPTSISTISRRGGCSIMRSTPCGREEYQDYLDHFTAVNSRAPDLVVLGVDFFGSPHNLVGKWRAPGIYLQKSGDPRYMLSSLLSLQLLRDRYALPPLSVGLVGPLEELDYYDRHNVRHFLEVITPAISVRPKFCRISKAFARWSMLSYSYNEDLPRIWKRLRRHYPQTRFVVFTTPDCGADVRASGAGGPPTGL